MRICTSEGIYGERKPHKNPRVSSGLYIRSNPENSEFHKPNTVEKALATVPVKRGDIVIVDFGKDDRFCKIIGCRPAIVVSATKFNMVSPIVTVIPMTKSLRLIDNPEHIFVDKDDCDGMIDSGMALCEQMCSADRSQIIKQFASIRDERLMEKINKAAQRQIGMSED